MAQFHEERVAEPVRSAGGLPDFEPDLRAAAGAAQAGAAEADRPDREALPDAQDRMELGAAEVHPEDQVAGL